MHIKCVKRKKRSLQLYFKRQRETAGRTVIKNDTYIHTYIHTYMYIHYHPSIHPSIHVSINPSINPSIYLSIYLSMYITYHGRSVLGHETTRKEDQSSRRLTCHSPSSFSFASLWYSILSHLSLSGPCSSPYGSQ